MSRLYFRLTQAIAVATAITMCGIATDAHAQNQQASQDQYNQNDQQRTQDNQRFQQERQQSSELNREQAQRDQQRDRERQQGRQQFDERSQRSDYQQGERNYRDQTNANFDRQQRDRSQARQQDNRGQSGAPAGLGVSVIEGDRGLYVREVAPNSPAEQAGIRPGDEILAINGRRVDSGNQLVQIVTQQEPGTEVDVVVDRDGQERTFAANLETRREALQFEGRQPAGDSRRGAWQDEHEFTRGNAAPWSADDIQRHVDELERQVQRMQQEIRDLRRMLNDNPSHRNFSQETVRTESSRDSQMNRTRAQDTRQQQGFERDQQNRARPSYDDPGFE